MSYLIISILNSILFLIGHLIVSNKIKYDYNVNYVFVKYFLLAISMLWLSVGLVIYVFN